METMKIELSDFGNLFQSEPAKLTDQELLSLDFILHRAWSSMREGHWIHFGEESWGFEDLIDLHAAVRDEMSQRAFQHTIADELDEQTQRFQGSSENEADADTSKGVRQAFGSYGGKRFLAHRIASYITHHRTYVEPFAGGAAVLFAKDPSPKEVLNDRDPEIAFMYRFIRDHTPEDRQALAKRTWEIDKDTHEKLKEMKPESDRDRFYKAFYLTRSSYGKQRGGSFNPANAGVRIDERLQADVRGRIAVLPSTQ